MAERAEVPLAHIRAIQSVNARKRTLFRAKARNKSDNNDNIGEFLCLSKMKPVFTVHDCHISLLLGLRVRGISRGIQQSHGELGKVGDGKNHECCQQAGPGKTDAGLKGNRAAVIGCVTSVLANCRGDCVHGTGEEWTTLVR